MPLIGANPVPPPIRITGRSGAAPDILSPAAFVRPCTSSSRKKNVPIGPRNRNRSFSFICVNTCVVNRPSGTRRMCSCRNSSSCGGLASEKLRRWLALSRISRYWPARNCRRWLAGSLSDRIMTSSAARSILITRAGSVLMVMPATAASSRAWITMSERGTAWQKSASPAARSCELNALSSYLP